MTWLHQIQLAPGCIVPEAQTERHSATRALLERDDVLIVASVSCIYGIGSVETYTEMTTFLSST